MLLEQHAANMSLVLLVQFRALWHENINTMTSHTLYSIIKETYK